MRRAPTKRFLFGLALKLGRVNPYAMARGMPAKLLLEWMAYAAVEPFDEMRADYRSAQIAQMLYNINRDAKKFPNGKPLGEFLLHFDGEEQPQQSVDEKTRVMALILNAQALAASESRVPKVIEEGQPAVAAATVTTAETSALELARRAVEMGPQ